jgi:serine/threonine-protein kinase
MRYALLCKIAAGGMGTVWVASRGLSARPLFAVKVAHAHLADDASFRRTIVREARAASLVVHPNVVRLFDVEEDAHEVRLVMEWVDGASLAELAEAGRLEPGVVARIVLDVIDGLSAVHARALIHRDVSPQNILVGTDGVAKLADFGLAKSEQSDASTTEGTVKGKLAYVAPEYVRGKTIDARVDVFALGVVFWESLAGKRLFRGASDAETLENVLRAEPPKLGRIDADLAALDPIVERLVAKDPLARADLAEARAAIAAAVTPADRARVAHVVHEAVGAKLADRHAQVARRLRRLRARAAAPWVAVVGASLAAVVAYASLHARSTPSISAAPIVATSAPSAVAIESAPIELDTAAPAISATSTRTQPRATRHAPAIASASASATAITEPTVRRPPPNPY